jgi:hypothetical protein
METLIHCVYASTATTAFAEHDIPALLEQARAKNARNRVTGMLLYVEGSFFQVLEGGKTAVAAIFEAIRRDTRHARIVQIIREPIAFRSFADWTMGFSTLGREEIGPLLGENDYFTDASCLARLGPGRAKKLLQAFQSGSWRSDQTGKFKVQGRVA